MARCYRCGRKVPKDIMYCPNCGYNLQLDDHSRFNSSSLDHNVPIKMASQRKGPPASSILFIAIFIIFIIIFLSQVLPYFTNTNEGNNDLQPALITFNINNDTNSSKDLYISINGLSNDIFYSDHIFIVSDFQHAVHYSHVFSRNEPVYLTIICNDTTSGQVYSSGILIISGLEYYVGLSLSDGTWRN